MSLNLEQAIVKLRADLEQAVRKIRTNIDTLISQGMNGWVPAPGTWTYASATTITVPTGAAAIYSVGDKARATNGTLKQFYIIGVADTLLTVAGGALATGAITAPSFSKSVSPVGFPGWFAWAPAIVGFSANPTVAMRFCIHGRLAHVVFQCSTVGTSNATSFIISIPIAARASGVSALAALPYAINNGASINGAFANIDSGAAVATLYTAGYGSWTASGTKSANFEMFYEI